MNDRPHTPQPDSKTVNFDGALQPGAVRLLQITDTHLLADATDTLVGVTTDQSLEQVLTQARADGEPDVAVVTGDLVHDDSPAAYRRLRAHLAGLPCPVYALAGNHDDPAVMHPALPGDNVHLAREARCGDWRLIFLDSRIPGEEGGRLDAGELDALETTLADASGDHVLVCLHHQPVPVGSDWMDTMALANADAFFEVLDRHRRVRAVIWGHVHQAFDARRADVRLLATPSTCFQFAPGSEEFAVDALPPGYRWLGLNPDGSVVTALRRLAHTPAALNLHSGGY